MTFDEWWTEHCKKQNRTCYYTPDKAVARSAWEAAKQDTLDELNASIRKAWPEDNEEETDVLLNDHFPRRSDSDTWNSSDEPVYGISS